MHWMLCLSRLSILLSKHIHTFLPITFLIFNGFSICKKFWKAETQGFSTIPSILYMSILSIQDKDLQCIQCYLCQHCWYKTHPHIPAHIFLNIQWIFNLQNILESWDSGLFNHTINTICWYCRSKTRISNAFNAIYVNTVDTVFTPHSTLYKVLCKSHKHQCRQCWQT